LDGDIINSFGHKDLRVGANDFWRKPTSLKHAPKYRRPFKQRPAPLTMGQGRVEKLPLDTLPISAKILLIIQKNLNDKAILKG
jgi:hypothetical protein